MASRSRLRFLQESIERTKVRFFRKQEQTNEPVNGEESVSISTPSEPAALMQMPFKVVLLGNPSVGKTCFAKLLTARRVADTTINTIGFDHYVMQLTVDGVLVTIQLWDTAGMEQFRSGLITQYYRNVDGVILMYDITDHNSFTDLSEWMGEIRRNCQKEDHLKLALVGNKCDMDNYRKVTCQEGQQYARQHDMAFMEMSAKNLQYLNPMDHLLENLAQGMLQIREENSLTRSMSAIIRLPANEEDDWVMLNAPSGPVPRRSHLHQDYHRHKNQFFNRCGCN